MLRGSLGITWLRPSIDLKDLANLEACALMSLCPVV